MILKKYHKILNFLNSLNRFQDDLDTLKTNQALAYFNSRMIDPKKKLNEYGFSVFSQFDEDGLINALVTGFDDISKNFIEFGVHDFTEANCRFLMDSLDWKGLIIEGNKRAFDKMKARDFYWKKNIQIINQFLDIENIVDVFLNRQFDTVGILSVDVDGNDWYLLEKSLLLNPSLIIVEYNSLFGSECPVSVPYNKNFDRIKFHKSGLYYGASLKAFEYLLLKNGYKLVGTNAGGNNAFFVKEDIFKYKNWFTSCDLAFKYSKFNESKMEDVTIHNLKSLPEDLLNLPLMFVDTKKMTNLKEIIL